MSLKTEIRQSAVNYITEFGYSEALIDPLLDEFNNLIDTLGESKFSELIRVICGGAPAPGAAEANSDAKTHAGPQPGAVLNDAMRHEILEMIRREIRSAGVLPAPAAGSGGETVPTAPPVETLSGPQLLKKAEKYMRKVMDLVTEDLSTLVGDKISLSNAVVKNVLSAEILAETKDRFITLETIREDGLVIYARASAPGLVKISGIMAMVPAAVLEEKAAKLNLNQGDLDTIKEVCNQMTGSISKAAKGDKYKLTQVVYHNEREKEEALFPEDAGEYISVAFTWGTTTESYQNVTLYVKVKDLSKII